MMETFRDLIGPENGEATWLQLSVRAVILFVFGVLCVRIAGRRTFAHMTPMDIVVALIVGSNLSRAMTGKAPFLGTMAATLVLVILHRLLAMATLRWGPLSDLIKGRSRVVVRDGRVDQRTLRRHGLSWEDLMQGLRLEQVERPEDVRLATVEANGRISVVPRR